ncbi:MAG: DUF4258 domain-containing protein [Candidatus Methanoperedens sp.]
MADRKDSRILDNIKKLISKRYYDVKLHTRKRMIERNIKIREVIEAIENGTIIEEYVDDKPLRAISYMVKLQG